MLTAVIATVLVSAAVAALTTWWSGTLNSLDGNRFEGAQFATQNVAPIGYALFALGLGLAAGAAFRRTLPAIGTTIVGYVGVRLLLQVYAQPHYLSTSKLVSSPGSSTSPPSGSWVLTSSLVDRAGHVASGSIPVPAGCNAQQVRTGACLARAGYRFVTTFHAPSQYWAYQWIDFAIYTVLAAALIGVAAVLTLRHDA